MQHCSSSVFFFSNFFFWKEAFTSGVHSLKISRPIMCHIPKWNGKELAAYGPLPAWLAYFFLTHGISVQANGYGCGIVSVKINISAMTALFASHMLFVTVKKTFKYSIVCHAYYHVLHISWKTCLSMVLRDMLSQSSYY